MYNPYGTELSFNHIITEYLQYADELNNLKLKSSTYPTPYTLFQLRNVAVSDQLSLVHGQATLVYHPYIIICIPAVVYCHSPELKSSPDFVSKLEQSIDTALRPDVDTTKQILKFLNITKLYNLI